MSVGTRLSRLWPPRTVLVALAAVVVLEAAVLWAYVRTAPGFTTTPRYLLYPFLWLNAAGLALVWTDLPDAASRQRRLAAAVAVGYFLVLAVVDGTIALAPASGIDVYWRLPPGWSPMVVADVGPFRVASIPFRVLGYTALAYLLYGTVLDASRSAIGGVVGLFSCVSCTLPVIAAAVSAVVGGTGLAVVTNWSQDLSTVVFLVTVAILTSGLRS